MRFATRLLVGVATLALTACADGTGPHSSEGVPILFSLQPPAAVSPAEIAALSNAFDLIDQYVILLEDSASAAVISADTLAPPSGENEHRFTFELPASSIGRAVLVTVVGLDNGLELYRASGHARVQEATSAPAPLVLSARYTGPGVRGTIASANGAGLAGVGVGLYQTAGLVASVSTEPDGTYLFLDVGVGAYTVEPVPPANQFVCPALRSVSVVSNESLVADFATTDSACQIDLLVLSGGDVDDTDAVASMFATSPGVNTDTFFFVNGTPGLSTLRQYDVVLLFNNGIFDETTQLGNEIAQYVQAGGNVVIGSFYWQGRSDSQFVTPGWGALEAIDPFYADTLGFTQQGGATYQANDLGTVADPQHPLMANVTSIVSLSGFGSGVLAKPTTTIVASWTDGRPFVGFRELGAGQRIVAVSLYPAAVQPTQVTGDVQELWENAVVWAGSAGGPIP